MARRRTGIGAFGVALLTGLTEWGLTAQVLDAAGQESRYPADALRCLGRYAYDAGLLQSEGASVLVGDRKYSVDMIDASNIMVGLPAPTDHQGEPLRESPEKDYLSSLRVGERQYPWVPLVVEAGGAVVFTVDYDFDLQAVSAALSRQKPLRDPSRVTYVRVFAVDTLQIRAFDEYGREEPSSASAACSAVVAACLAGLADREAIVHNRGGDIFVEWEESDNALYATAPVSYVFTGSYDTSDLPAEG